MTRTNLDPLLRSMIGFADHFASVTGQDAGFPPYNVEAPEKGRVDVSVAAAGFGQDDLAVEMDGRTLVIRGSISAEEPGRNFIHRGIARRSFARRFALADGWDVEGADYENGVLTVHLRKEEPEVPQPKRIEIARKDA